ncbi:hypothetical protein KY330_02600 [Candidatus Woesearchaeota archaeon]|nr:hypothetical protein [Candidatus Woesearchaeota archaeon]
MEKRLIELIRKGFTEKRTIEEIKHSLISQGFLEDDVIKALNQVSKDLKLEKTAEKDKTTRYFLTKEILDRIGYGFGSQQFINILLLHTGAGFFLIGLINGIRSLISVLISSFLTKVTETSEISSKLISRSGIVFGFSFLLMAIARFLKSIPLFIFALLLSAISIVSHGELYERLFSSTLKKEKRGTFLSKIASIGLLIIAVSILLSGYLMTKFPETGTSIMLLGKQIRIYGYLISFEITALAFIISGYVLSFIKQKTIQPLELREEFSNFYYTLKHQTKQYLKNKIILILIISATITGFTEVLGYSYYGIYIYDTFKDVALKGFINVAVIFLIAILVSLFSPSIARRISKKYGKVPMLVFGTVLLSILPFTFYFNPALITIGIATSLSVIGSSLVGLASGLLISDLIVKRDRKVYFATFSLIVTIPYIITIPLGALFAQLYGIRTLFLYLGIILLAIVAPLYFLILVTHRKQIV